MATIIGEAGGWLMDQINDFMADEIVSQISTSEANRLWMLPLLVRKARGKRGMSKDNSVGSKANDYNKATTKTTPPGKEGDRIYEYTNPVREQVILNGGPDLITLGSISPLNNAVNHPSRLRELAGVTGNSLFANYKPPKNEIIIMNVSTDPYICLTLQNRPPEIDIDPQPIWVEVRSMARNTPFMMYTGSTDTIQFDISWYSNQPNKRNDVITKCKLLETWSKSNGYYSAPPILKIKWGSSEIFRDYYFVLYSAKYTLSNFQDSCVNDVNSGFVYDNNGIALEYNRPTSQGRATGDNLEGNLQYRDLGLYPATAVQHLIFKRVSDTNITHNMILNPNWLNGIEGYYSQEIPSNSPRYQVTP